MCVLFTKKNIFELNKYAYIVVNFGVLFFSSSFFLHLFYAAVMQRITVDVGQIRLIGIATCLYLCMDSCGNLYCSVGILVFLFLSLFCLLVSAYFSSLLFVGELSMLK